MKKVALITGVTGQDGSYLAEFYSRKDMKFMVLNGGLLHLTQIVLIIFIKIHTHQIRSSIFIMAI